MSSLPLCLIVAATRNRVIGRDNAMPWHLPEDLRYFKARTLGKPVIMGRKTWESLGRPLPGRLNIVVSRQPDLQLDGAEVFADLTGAVERGRKWAEEQGVDEVMLIGGGQLYHQALAQASRVYLTRIELELEGDTWFPQLPFDEWQRVDAQPQPELDGRPAYTFEVWERREPAQ
ncbi:dihydrofolate reductase [Thiopseudomonas denitrificans]|uniref:Dihydrofolate reductase n=1 Tax=Thiopseudomonas denitrificans TaxID=1501432 RepID=A0A4R6U1P1_9GAMM|nr:dihydrofolate reductase [Thiopseudomonas denitrificans]TDQ38255.1 dihydrofolate reductase [Thiopseudomonas denitrificans]